MRRGETLTWAEYDAWLAQVRPHFLNPDASLEVILAEAFALLNGRKFSGSVKPLPSWLALWLLRKPYGTLSAWQMLTERDYADPKLFGMPLPLKGQSKVKVTQASEAPLKGFVFNLLTRKLLLAHGYSLVGVLSLACGAVAVARWYAATLALMAGRMQTEPEDMVTAIRLVERYYTGHQPRFLAKFLGWPWRGLAGFMLKS